MKPKRILIWTTVVGVFTGACGSKDDDRLFVYPSKIDLTVHHGFGPYESVEAARDAAASQMTKYPTGDYEIGKNCEKRKGSSLWTCEETFR